MKFIKNYNTILFDFDLTLFDSSKSLNIIYKQTFTNYHIPYNEYDSDLYIKESLKKTWDRFKDPEDKKSFHMFKDYFDSISDSIMMKYAKPYPETRQVLQWLYKNNKIIGIVTGEPKRIVNVLLEKYQLNTYIKNVIGMEDYKKHKPNPESLLKMINILQCNLNKTCYIGDSKNDMLAAEKANIDCILIDRTLYNSNKKTINSLVDLVK